MSGDQSVEIMTCQEEIPNDGTREKRAVARSNTESQYEALAQAASEMTCSFNVPSKQTIL